MNDLKRYLSVSPEVRSALEENRPVVALESTIISHGMPYPKNVETALRVEEIIREHGAVPATIAVIRGKMTVGCTKEQIEYLGKRGLDGATTVTTTMIAAAAAGVKIFATGGIGGVHRGAETTMDISADLEELAQTPVLVVCAGCKSILDIGLTLEYLETKGVPVLGYKTGEMPAFYTTHSGFQVDYRMEGPEDVAAVFCAKLACGLKGGMLLTNPIPEQYAMDLDYINANIDAALKECDEKGIRGKGITPFLLDKIQKLTGGKSLEANIQLVYNNAAVGAEVARALCAAEKE